jgi:1,4-dihydroxy-2-naphthoyl-CoA hydrolase
MDTDKLGIAWAGTIHESLGIHAVEASPERVVLEMDVGPKVHQPFGLLHGGASAVLAESAASLGAYLAADPETRRALGIELNISHLKAVRDGVVRAEARPLRLGRTLQVWSVEIADGEGDPVAAARCTLAIRPAEAEA